MFDADIVWRGIIYTILMLLAKLLTGLWLVRFDIRIPSVPILPPSCSKWSWLKVKPKRQPSTTTATATEEPKQSPPSNSKSYLLKPLSLYPPSILGSAMVARGEIGFLISSLAESKGIFTQSSPLPSSSSSASFSSEQDVSRIFLVVTWAIVLCTVIGPVAVGSLVRRVKRLKGKRGEGASGQDPLGVWGVS